MTDRILYFLTPNENVSPFDVTLAIDAGFDHVIPITNVKTGKVTNYVQDAIFARPPKRFNDTGVFIGGRDIHMATDMMEAAKDAMVGPFKVGLFTDPNGAYTTSAAVAALAEFALIELTGNGMRDTHVSVFGPGPVGICTAILAAKQGANVSLCPLIDDDEQGYCMRFCERYNVKVEWKPAQTQKLRSDILAETEVVISTAKAGIRILENEYFNSAENILLALDTNAVPPSGIECIEPHSNLDKTILGSNEVASVGPFTIGNLKYKVQSGLFKRMHTSEKASVIDFTDSYEFALTCLLENMKKAA